MSLNGVHFFCFMAGFCTGAGALILIAYLVDKWLDDDIQYTDRRQI